MDRRDFMKGTAGAVVASALPLVAKATDTPVEVSIRTREVEGPLPHIWEECAGSDRAAITLRESWGPALASRGEGDRVAVMIWNLAEVTQPSGVPLPGSQRIVKGEPKRYRITFEGVRPQQRVQVRYVDQERGSPLPAWRAMGSPQYPTMEQVRHLRESAEIPRATAMRLDGTRQLTLDLPPEGVALIELV